MIGLRQCAECEAQSVAFCEHRGVLIVWMDGAQIAIRGATERHARQVADTLSLKWRGRRFYSSQRKAQQQLAGVN